MQILRKKILPGYVVPLVILVSLMIVLFFNVTRAAVMVDDVKVSFLSMEQGLDAYYDFKTAWKPRLFSNVLALWTNDLGKWILEIRNFSFVDQLLGLQVGLWTAGWFGLMGLLLIGLKKQRATFYIFGFFAGLSFGYADWPGGLAASRVYPWDMPAFFFFLLFTFLFVRRKYSLLLILLPLSIGFKETTVIFSAVYLFADDLSWKKRLIYFISSLVLCAGVKIGLDLYTHSPVLFTMETGLERSDVKNIYIVRNLLGFRKVVPFFINAGTLLSLLLLPVYDRNVLAMKFLSIIFIAGNLIFGNISEFRIYFEMLPFALYALEISMFSGDGFDDGLEF